MIPSVRKAGILLLALASLVEAGCSHVPKEKSAPCRRPATMTSYASVDPRDCGPMTLVNDNPAAVRAAIEGQGG